jgi:hypothetical protein
MIRWIYGIAFVLYIVRVSKLLSSMRGATKYQKAVYWFLHATSSACIALGYGMFMTSRSAGRSLPFFYAALCILAIWFVLGLLAIFYRPHP